MLVKDYKILRKTGRLLNGNESDAGTIYHAVVKGDALCGTKPGRLSDWSLTEGKQVTCAKCLKKLNQTLLLEATRNIDHPHDPKETSILDEVSQNLDIKNKGDNA